MTELMIVKEILPVRQAQVTNSVTRQSETKSVQPLILHNGRDEIFVEAWGDVADKCRSLRQKEAIMCHLAASSRSFQRQDGTTGYGTNITLVSFVTLFPETW